MKRVDKMNEKNDTSKNILGKLKRLMTVTEKDVIEENEKEKNIRIQLKKRKNSC